jgi:hypothetical protein
MGDTPQEGGTAVVLPPINSPLPQIVEEVPDESTSALGATTDALTDHSRKKRRGKKPRVRQAVSGPLGATLPDIKGGKHMVGRRQRPSGLSATQAFSSTEGSSGTLGGSRPIMMGGPAGTSGNRGVAGSRAPFVHTFHPPHHKHSKAPKEHYKVPLAPPRKDS